MRIASINLFEAGVSRLTDGQAALARLQNQISSGQKLLTPSDDPVASARVVELTQQKAQIDQYFGNRQSLAGTMAQTEVTLSSVTSLLQSAQAQALAAGNSTLNAADRKAMAVTVSAQLEQLIGLANSKDAAGNSVFAGFKSGADAFAVTAAGVAYQGDQGEVLVQVDSARKMPANIPGDRLFQGNGKDLFAALTSLRDLLTAPQGTPAEKAAYQSGLKAVNDTLAGGLENVTVLRSMLGANMLELDDLDAIGSAHQESITKTLAGLQSLDYNDAITQLTSQKTVLDAAQATFARVAGMSLFDYIN